MKVILPALKMPKLKRSKMQSYIALPSLCLIILFVAVVCHPDLCYATENYQDGGCDDSSNTCSPNESCERYISASYFRNFKSLVDDSVFQGFISEKLDRPLAWPSLLSVSKFERNLIGEGSHRLLSSFFRFVSLNSTISSDLSTSSCEVIVIERLPSGVFADPFELEHLLQRAVFKDGAVFGDTDLELPSFVSDRSVVEIHMDAVLSSYTGKENGLELKMEIPLHVRYPPIDESGYSTVRFGEPALLMRCGLKGKRCLLTSIVAGGGGDLRADPLEWSIPCGVKAHSGIVSVLTFGSAILATATIIAASLYYSDYRSSKNVKQS